MENILFRATISDKGKITDLLNVDFKNGKMAKRKGWKTFRGMVSVLKDLNKKYKKLSLKGAFTIQLPIKGGQ